MRELQRFFYILVFLLSACTKAPTDSLVGLDVAKVAAVPSTVTLIIQNYKPQSGQVYQNLFVSNFSVGVNNGALQYSSARDGMSDALKTSLQSTYGFTTLSPESALSGFQDLVLFKSGITTSQQTTLHCAPSQTGSSSNDILNYNDSRQSNTSMTLGLRDCDKVYLGLNPQLFDNNSNGIPDYLELRCGMNPLNKIQSALSTSADGVTNLEKCRRHIPIAESISTQPNQLYAYNYANSVNPDGSQNFTVSNIPVLNGAQDNFIALYLVETNPTTKASNLYTAFLILKSGQAGQTLTFPYWATSASTFTNQQIIIQ